MNDAIEIINIAPLRSPEQAGPQTLRRLAQKIGRACRDLGFFYICGHGVAPELPLMLERASRRFFALREEEKHSIQMSKGGRAWRGYFALGQELTLGRPDQKEGLYFGEELSAQHPAVARGLPLHGANLFPAQVPWLRPLVLEYMKVLTALSRVVMVGLAMSLGLSPDYFEARYTADPLTLFRIFHYPPAPPLPSLDAFGVGAHTDYGLLTVLWQDASGGLQVRSKDAWIDAPPIDNTFVCNLGDMLDRLTGGAYRSTLHRVRAGADRIAMPFFFDPNFEVKIQPLPSSVGRALPKDAAERWDHRSVDEPHDTYGRYLLSKISRVFPALFEAEL